LEARIRVLCGERNARVQRMNAVFASLHAELAAVKAAVAAFLPPP
jgi:hypothetical protein